MFPIAGEVEEDKFRPRAVGASCELRGSKLNITQEQLSKLDYLQNSLELGGN